MCTFCRKFYKGGGGFGHSTSLRQKFWKNAKSVPNAPIHPEMKRNFFPLYRPPHPSPPCSGDSIVYFSLADVALAFWNATKNGRTVYCLGPLLCGTLGSNVGGVVIKVQRYI